MINSDNYPKILFLYLTKLYIKNILIVLFIFLFLIYLIDFIELYRRASQKINFSVNAENNYIFTLVYMSFLKSPHTLKNILPITILISSIFTFIKWRQNNYFVIVRTNGISLQKTIFPICFTVLAIGIFSTVFLNPFSNFTNNKYKFLEQNYFGHKKQESVSLSKHGIWIRKKVSDGFLIIKAASIQNKKNTLNDVEIFKFNHENNFKNKLISQTAALKNDKLVLKNGIKYEIKTSPQKFKISTIELSNRFDSFKITSENPENLNLIELYDYIFLMKKLGFNFSNHLIYLLKELLQPILMVSMILICAPMILRNNERKFPLTIMCLTILIGFVIYFTVDFIYVLGSMDKLNPFIAGVGPVAISFFTGCFLVSAFDEVKK